MDNFNFELAIKFCERALDMEPDNVEVLEMAGAVFLETGDVEKAKSVSFQFHMPFINTQIFFYLKILTNKSSSLTQCRPDFKHIFLSFCVHCKLDIYCDNSFYYCMFKTNIHAYAEEGHSVF